MSATWKRLNPNVMAGGYLRVHFWPSGAKILVHRLVLEAFIGPCPEGMQGCHNNGNPADNRLENLRWDTRSENARDSMKHGTHFRASGELNGAAIYSPEMVKSIRAEYAAGGVTMRQIAERRKIGFSTVQRIVRRKSWKNI